MRAGKGKEGGFLPLSALPLIMKVLEKESQGLEKESEGLEKNITIWITWIKDFNSAPSFKRYRDF